MAISSRNEARTVLPIVFLGIAIGWIVAHGNYLTSESIFAPWHHDDFSALSGPTALKFSYVRPVSTNFIFFFGQFGVMPYYLVFFFVSFGLLTLAAHLSALVFGVTFRPLASMALGFVGSLCWFSQQSSAQSVQYLGLMTNALSGFLGFTAALILLHQADSSASRLSWGKALGFAACCLATAFAKEDMVVFLSWTALFVAATIYLDHKPGIAIRFFATAMTIIIMSYAASLFHSHWFNSPFVTARSGPYDVSQPFHNAAANLKFFIGLSVANVALVLGWLLILGIAFTAVLRSQRLNKVFKGSLFVFVSYFALMAPYLILPRQIPFYTMNFVPLLCFGMIPAAIAVSEVAMPTTSARVRLISTLSVVSAIFISFYFADASARNANLNWVKITREKSLKQIHETTRAGDLGLKSCALTLVTGVSEVIGPFLSPSSDYLAKKLGILTRWRIVAPPGSFLDTYARSGLVRESPDWKYVSNGAPFSSESCHLDFDPSMGVEFRNR